MSKDPPCPAHGWYTRDGVKQYYRTISRVFCILQPYEECDSCSEKSFTLLLPKLDTETLCPVLSAVLSNKEPPEDEPYLHADWARLKEAPSLPKAVTVTINTCKEIPFQYCAGCPVKLAWTANY